MCGFTLGLAAANVTEDPVVKECVDEPGELVSTAALGKTELWRHTVHGWSHNKEYLALVMMMTGVHNKTHYLNMRQLDLVWVDLGFVEKQQWAGSRTTKSTQLKW